MPRTHIDNVLAARYATEPMRRIWSAEQKIRFERHLWIAVMTAQKELGVEIPAEAIAAYEKARDEVNLERIAERERALRHDVKARIEEFNALAGYEHIHKGMTSRDLTENVEMLQAREAMSLLRNKCVSILRHLSELAGRWADVPIVARTHNVAAQPTTVGRRVAMFGQEMLLAFYHLQSVVTQYRLRGIVGPVGTALDQLTLFGGDAAKAAALNQKVLELLGFKSTMNAVGQVYPRSLDFQVVSAIYQLSAAPSNFCRSVRLMAGHELASEGFIDGQVGSSAMPHKMNSRSCERVNGFRAILNGYMTMAAALAGDQWNEGDVSCSVVRRVALPDSFFAADGMFETFLTILNEMVISEAGIQAEFRRYVPFLATTTILMESVKRGAGREKAHEAIKNHAVAVARAMREEGLAENDLARRLGADPAIPLSQKDIEGLLENTEAFLGAAKEQIEAFRAEVGVIAAARSEAANYEPGEIL